MTKDERIAMLDAQNKSLQERNTALVEEVRRLKALLNQPLMMQMSCPQPCCQQWPQQLQWPNPFPPSKEKEESNG